MSQVYIFIQFLLIIFSLGNILQFIIRISMQSVLYGLYFTMQSVLYGNLRICDKVSPQGINLFTHCHEIPLMTVYNQQQVLIKSEVFV